MPTGAKPALAQCRQVLSRYERGADARHRVVLRSVAEPSEAEPSAAWRGRAPLMGVVVGEWVVANPCHGVSLRGVCSRKADPRS